MVCPVHAVASGGSHGNALLTAKAVFCSLRLAADRLHDHAVAPHGAPSSRPNLDVVFTLRAFLGAHGEVLLAPLTIFSITSRIPSRHSMFAPILDDGARAHVRGGLVENPSSPLIAQSRGYEVVRYVPCYMRTGDPLMERMRRT